MNDETKAELMKRTREWLQSCVNAATRSGVPEEADLEAFILAHIDGEPARLAAALENLREACARHWEQTADAADDLVIDDLIPTDVVRATPLDATPLADALEALRKERDDLALDLRGVKEGELVVVTTAEYDELRALRARVAELEAEVSRRDALIRSDGYDDMRAHAQELARRAEKAEAQVVEERNIRFTTEHLLREARTSSDWHAAQTQVVERAARAAEAQVAAARAMCLRFNANPESAMPSPVSMVLRAMDEAAKEKP